MNYERDTEEGLYFDRLLDDDHTLRFQAEYLKQEPTGVHARVSIFMNGVRLTYDRLNLDKDDQRVRLANSTYKLMEGNGLTNLYRREYLKHELDLFCIGLWDAHTGAMAPELCVPPLVIPPKAYALHPFLVEQSVVFAYSPPGAGKTNLALLMAASINSGVSTYWPVRQGKALFINLERSRQSVLERLSNVNAVLGLPRSTPMMMLHQRGRSFFDVLPVVRRACLTDGVDVVFLDSISRAGMGDLTANAPANAITDALGSLKRTAFCIGHAPRSDSTHMFGSVMFDAGGDVMLQVSSQRGDDLTLGVRLSVSKENDLGYVPPQVWAMEFTRDIGLTGLREPTIGEFPELERGRMTLREQVYAYLLDVGHATTTDVAKALDKDRSTISTILHAGGGHGGGETFVKLPKQGREQPYGLRSLHGEPE